MSGSPRYGNSQALHKHDLAVTSPRPKHTTPAPGHYEVAVARWRSGPRERGVGARSRSLRVRVTQAAAPRKSYPYGSLLGNERSRTKRGDGKASRCARFSADSSR